MTYRRVSSIMFLFCWFLTIGCTRLPDGYNVLQRNPETTIAAGTIVDIDGNVYHTVAIGTQVWMAENLRTTKLNDGTLLPQVTVLTQWSALSSPAYCFYDNKDSIKSDGALYNWYAVNTGKLAPAGWHVSTIDEWKTLSTTLGGDSLAGGALKDTASRWGYNVGATNSSGFTGFLCGTRSAIDENAKAYGFYWTSTPYSPGMAWHTALINYNTALNENGNLINDGMSIRCVKD